MQCPKCNSQLLQESTGNGNVKVKCNNCGLTEIRNAKGQKQLLG